VQGTGRAKDLGDVEIEEGDWGILAEMKF